ncbi:hypothetical protein U9R90_17900 [Streptomyces sp. E11-3]|uniref:hypothetical protein n=1 Tax=Streptomyces sp. E11-3 TaxID=3110112 RepID=UPI0039816432
MAALTAVVALAVLLPLAGAFAGQPADDAPEVVRADDPRGADASRGVDDPKGADALRGADGLRGADDRARPREADAPGSAERCGPELISPDGIEAQTCVLFQGEQAWARTYYRNATGGELRAVLALMGPGGRTVQMHCAVAAGDEPGACDTPRERAAGKRSAYTAMAEFAAPERAASESGAELGHPELLLRVGSNPA